MEILWPNGEGVGQACAAWRDLYQRLQVRLLPGSCTVLLVFSCYARGVLVVHLRSKSVRSLHNQNALVVRTELLGARLWYAGGVVHSSRGGCGGGGCGGGGTNGQHGCNIQT